jgi:hypothetical protein
MDLIGDLIVDNVAPAGSNKLMRLDVVAHSMGFAYSLGMLDAIKNSQTFKGGK